MAFPGDFDNVETDIDYVDILASEIMYAIEPIELAYALCNCHIITDQCFSECFDMSVQGSPRQTIVYRLLTGLSQPSRGVYWHVVRCILCENGYQFLAQTIEICIRKSGFSKNIVKLPINNNTSTRGYYMAMRHVLETGSLQNPRAQFAALALKRKSLLGETPRVDKKVDNCMADKYAATLVIKLVIPPSKNDIEAPCNYMARLENAKELEKIAPRTTNPLLTMLMLCSRLIAMHAFAGNFQQCETSFVEGFQLASMTAPCPELATLYYCHAYYLLKKFETDPTSQTRSELEASVLSGLAALHNTDFDLDRFSMEQFLLMKLVFCLLGIGITCRVIQRMDVSQESIFKAKMHLARMGRIWPHVATRRRMMYYVAKGRIEEIYKNKKMSCYFIRKAIKYARKGHFSEGVVIKKYLRQCLSMDSLRKSEKSTLSQVNHDMEHDGVKQSCYGLCPNETHDIDVDSADAYGELNFEGLRTDVADLFDIIGDEIANEDEKLDIATDGVERSVPIDLDDVMAGVDEDIIKEEDKLDIATGGVERSASFDIKGGFDNLTQGFGCIDEVSIETEEMFGEGKLNHPIRTAEQNTCALHEWGGIRPDNENHIDLFENLSEPNTDELFGNGGMDLNSELFLIQSERGVPDGISIPE